MTMKELTGQLTSITHSPEVVILAFQENGQAGAVAFSLPNLKYHELFPAGDLVLGQEVIVVIDQTTDQHDQITVSVQAIYDPDGDFIAVDEVTGDNLMTAAEHDIYAELRAQRDQQIAQIKIPDDELDSLAREHDQQNTAENSQQPDYGDLVSDSIPEEGNNE